MKKNQIITAAAGATLALGATIFLLRMKRNNKEQKPPKNAPQLDIKNPGEQSEFTTLPEESEMER